TGLAGDGPVAAERGVVFAAARLLRSEQHSVTAGDDGLGALEIHRAVTLRGSRRVGEFAGIGSHPGGAHVARQAGVVISAKRTRGAMEHRLGEGMDGAGPASRTDVLCGWAC